MGPAAAMAVRLELTALIDSRGGDSWAGDLGLDIPEALEDACNPATMAVIVYDMQAGVLRQLPDGGAEAAERVSRVLACGPGRRLSGVLHPAYVPSAKATGNLAAAHGDGLAAVDGPEKVDSWFLRDTPGFQIAPKS